MQERKWHICYISSLCNSLGRLSLEIELGSRCFHLEKQTKHSAFWEDLNRTTQITKTKCHNLKLHIKMDLKKKKIFQPFR